MPKVSSNSLTYAVKIFRQDDRRCFIDDDCQGVIHDLAARCERIAKRALLSLRRNQFIALLDSTAHPTIRLSRLAPLVQRVAAPAK